MNNKEIYKQKNLDFLDEISKQEDIKRITNGLYYKVLQAGDGMQARTNSVVSVYYTGRLINGRIFDSNVEQSYPDAFHLTKLIRGWQAAIPYMCVGDKWEIYMSAEMGYGSRGMDSIPANSTLIFEIELKGVA